MIWGVTGTRHGATNPQLVSVAWLWNKYTITGLHNGDCKGVDAQAFFLAKAFGSFITLHPPTNGDWRAFLDKYADDQVEVRPHCGYFTRDKHIVIEAMAMVAVPLQNVEADYGGTWKTVGFTRERKKPLAIVWPNGFISYEHWTLDG